MIAYRMTMSHPFSSSKCMPMTALSFTLNVQMFLPTLAPDQTRTCSPHQNNTDNQCQINTDKQCERCGRGRTMPVFSDVKTWKSYSDPSSSMSPLLPYLLARI